MLARVFLLKEVKPSGDRKMITFDKFVSVTTTRGTMTKAFTISRQNDAENLVFLVALVAAERPKGASSNIIRI